MLRVLENDAAKKPQNTSSVKRSSKIASMVAYTLYRPSMLPLYLWYIRCTACHGGVKGYISPLNHVFTLTSTDLSSNRVIRRISIRFEKSCLDREVKPPEWNLSMVFRSLTHLPHEPMKLSSDKQLTQKTCFLPALALAERINELHGLSY